MLNFQTVNSIFSNLMSLKHVIPALSKTRDSCFSATEAKTACRRVARILQKVGFNVSYYAIAIAGSRKSVNSFIDFC